MAEMNLVQTRVDAIRRLVRRKATQPLTRALTKSSAADIAEALAHLTRNECLFLAKHLPDTIAGETLLTCNEETLRVLIDGVAFERLTRWLDEMEPDDTGAHYVVTKNSGHTGGFQEKLEAARQTGATVIAIERGE